MSFCDYEMDTLSLNCFLIAETDQKKTPDKKNIMLQSKTSFVFLVRTAMRYLIMKQQTRKKLQILGTLSFCEKEVKMLENELHCYP